MTTLERKAGGRKERSRGASASAVAAIGVVTAVATLALWSSGVSISDVAQYLIYIVVLVLWPGTLLWRVSYRRSREGDLRTSWCLDLEDLACGLAAGYALELASYLVARSIGQPRMWIAAPLLLAVTLSVHVWRMRRHAAPVTGGVGLTTAGIWTVAAVLIYVVVYFAQGVFVTHPLEPTQITDPDEMFHLALVGELRHHFPATYPYVEYPGRLTYQWFVHAHMAAASWVTGVEAEVLYRRFEPLTLALIATVGTALVAVRVSQVPVAGPLAVVLLVLVGSFDISGTAVGEAAAEDRFLYGLMLMHSPTQALAYVVSIPVLVMGLDLLTKPVSWRPPWPVWIGATFVVSGAKVAFLPLYVCGLISAAVVAGVTRDRRWRRCLIAAALTICVLLISSWLLYGGDGQSLRWAPLQTVDFYMARLGTGGGGEIGKLVFGTALLVMWGLSGAGMVVLFAMRAYRRDLRVWFLAGGACAGYGATFLLGHGGNSQLFFGRAAVPLLAVLSAWGMAILVDTASSRKRWAMIVSAVLGGVTLLGVRWFTEGLRTMSPLEGGLVEGPLLRVWVNLPALMLLMTVLLAARMMVRDLTDGRLQIPASVILAFLLGLGLARPLATVVGHVAPEGKPYSYAQYGADGRAAMRWLRLHSSSDERIMTNAHCGPVRRNEEIPCDARHFWMSALSERRFVIEGWAYTARSDSDWSAPFWGDPELLADNDRLLASPDSSELARFVVAHDVGWIVLDLREPADLASLAADSRVTLRWSQGNYAVLRAR